jgi:hypothetical protein
MPGQEQIGKSIPRFVLGLPYSQQNLTGAIPEINVDGIRRKSVGLGKSGMKMVPTIRGDILDMLHVQALDVFSGLYFPISLLREQGGTLNGKSNNDCRSFHNQIHTFFYRPWPSRVGHRQDEFPRILYLTLTLTL